MSPEFITVDDRDPSVIYTGDSAAWNLGGVYPEYDNTTHGASSSATPGQIHFSFQGIRVTVYGTIGPAATSLVSMYSLDGSPASTYTAMSTQVTLYRQQYFDSGVLEDGQHELAISVLSGQNATVWFDFFQYLPSSGPFLARI
ncbi:hypothetical protein BJ138DRAFT_1015896 [Hygrophoropsis aurantiaca]|uniref:Uncharacterized protein n=1 Tax=Hygrophoropsis aurantiaca TaxID=72124 RepID=A0ACB8A106_9AGAM|nr:hypothetical protein BJ138DRAFT_1015896 [Hygrophoropsis aurantiaca]